MAQLLLDVDPVVLSSPELAHLSGLDLLLDSYGLELGPKILVLSIDLLVSTALDRQTLADCRTLLAMLLDGFVQVLHLALPVLKPLADLIELAVLLLHCTVPFMLDLNAPLLSLDHDSIGPFFVLFANLRKLLFTLLSFLAELVSDALLAGHGLLKLGLQLLTFFLQSGRHLLGRSHLLLLLG